MIQERDVRSKIAALLLDDMSTEDFSRWIVDESWNMHQDSAPAAIDLVSRVQLLMAERDDLALDESTFRRRLAALFSSAAAPKGDE